MNWVLAVAAAWFALAGVVAVLIGRIIRMADRKAEAKGTEAKGAATIAEDAPNFVVDTSPQVEADVSAEPVSEGRPAEPRSAAERPRPDVPTARPPEPGMPPSERGPSPRRADLR
jgi:hypothetical protein